MLATFGLLAALSLPTRQTAAPPQEEEGAHHRRGHRWGARGSSSRRVAEHAWLRAVLALLLALAILCGAAGTFIVALVLVNEQHPDGDSISTTTVPVAADHWLLGKGVVFGFLGWLPTVITMPFVPVVFDLGWAGRATDHESREKSK